MTEFERAADLAGGTLRPAGDGPVVEVLHATGVYSRFAPDAACRLRTHDNGHHNVVVELEEGDGWFEAGDPTTVIEVRRGGAAIVASDGAAVAVKGERDGRTIIVAVDGAIAVMSSDGDRVVLEGQAAMLDRAGRIGQVVDVTAEQVASEPWIARNRALEPMPMPTPTPEVLAEPEPAVEPEPVVEPEPEPVAAEPEPEPLPAFVVPETEAAWTPLAEDADEPYDDPRGPRTGGRRWPRLVMAGLLLVAALALLLPRPGTNDGGSEDDVSSATITAPPTTTATTAAPTTAAPATTAAQSETAEPAPAGAVADPAPATETTAAAADEVARGDAPFTNELVACRRAGAQVTFTGRLTNAEDVTRRYRLHVVFTGSAGTAVERRQVEIEVPAGETEPWQVTSSAGGRLQGGSCDLERVEPLG